MRTGILCNIFGGKNTPMRNSEKGKNDRIKNEKCILCGKDTGIPFNEPINYRKYFIDGCGQLCEDCFDSLKYASISDWQNNPSNEEMEMLLQMTRKNGKKCVYEQST